MFVTFSWKAKYYSLLRSFIVFFIKLTSSFTFFFFSDFFPVNYSSIYSYSAISLSFLELSVLFWLEAAEVFKVFLTDVERTGFSFFGSSFFGYYFLGGVSFFYFFIFTPELLSELTPFGGILLVGIVGWLGF